MTENSFKISQEALLLSLEEKLIDDQFAVLYEEFTPQNLLSRHWDYEKFSLENKDPAECKMIRCLIPSNLRMVPFVIQKKDFVLY